MSIGRKNQDPPIPVPDRDASERLFEKITQELDIQPKEKRRRRNYRAEATFLYAAPKIAALLLVMAALLFLLAEVTTPSTVKDLDRTPTKNGERISFSVTRPMMVDSVSASLNGRDLPVGQEAESYWVNITENGDLDLQLQSILGNVWTTRMFISGLDTQTPHLAGYETEGTMLRIYLTDGEDGSGIDWSTAGAYYTGSGEAYPIEGTDEAESAILLSIPQVPVTVRVSDRKGNELSVSVIPGS